jgi:hypothetical protein
VTAAGIWGVAHASAALSPFASESGKISLSVDALGSNDPAGGMIRVQKNAGATVRKAWLFAATTGFSGYVPQDGDVTLAGTAVSWGSTMANAIASYNAEADVTSIVKPIVDAAPAGIVDLSLAEGMQTGNYDGEILAVVLDDPTVSQSGSVILMYGSQTTTGDSFNVALSQPVDKTNPSFGLDLGLGISFGYQTPGYASQYSTVDVNGQRLTSSAGGQDDGQAENGALITAGGVGDTDANPGPYDSAGCDTAPRCDDELYSLLPFVTNGDTTLAFTTQNPSNDDNIFFAALNVHASAAIVGEGIVLGPVSATNPTGTNHTLTATVQDANGNPVSGTTVTFTATAGPNKGMTGTGVTDAKGHATFTYSSSATGTDTWTASFVDAAGATQTSNEATKTWTAESGDTTSPVCVLNATLPGPPKAIQVLVQDAQSGIKSIVVDDSANATTVVPSFTAGDTGPQLVTSTKDDQALSSHLALTVTDMAGNVTKCDPLVPGMGRSGALHGLVTRTFAGVDAKQTKVTIANGAPGLGTFLVRVNGRPFTIHVAAGHRRTIDVAPAMKPGKHNTIVVKAQGASKGSATATITS